MRQALWCNPLFHRFSHTKRLHTIHVGVLRGWRIYSALVDGVNMTLGSYERDGQRWLQSRLRGGADFVAVDAGCYMGFYSLLIARILSETGGGTVFAFDPNKNNIACLERSAAANPAAKIVAIANALGSHCGTVRGSASDGVRMVTLVGDRGASQAEEFTLVTLDSLLETKIFSRVDFIKIDVEGFEMELLHGARKLLERYRPQILIELHSPALAEAAYDLLVKAGYSFCDLHGQPVSRNRMATAELGYKMWAEPKRRD